MRREPMKRTVLMCLGIIILSIAMNHCTENEYEAFEAPWPEWIFHHWVWEDESTSESVIQMVEGYLSRDIPVGAIIIDSPWETGYNTFEWDTNYYPDPEELISYLHAKNIRVFMWIVSTINVDSPNYDEPYNKGYFLGNGATVEWWKGTGSFIDYTNPEALEYWHGLMDKVLNLGIDGWKCDGTDFSVQFLSDKTAYSGEEITWDDYRIQYYTDFYEYTRQRLGNDRVITARPIDTYGFGAAVASETLFAPKPINYCGWVGDQDPDFGGLKDAMINVLASSKYDYVGCGSDIGGYRGDGMREKSLLIRWAQYGAFCPIMENGGSGNHFPWDYDAETVSIYKKFVDIHYNLIPYFQQEYAYAYKRGISMIQPPEGVWSEYNDALLAEQTKYCYKLGRDIFVAPIVEDSTQRQIDFPTGDNWIDWWTGDVYAGGTSVTYDCPLDQYPVFKRVGANLLMD